jgi:uncharacterized protein (DUF1778 family)
MVKGIMPAMDAAFCKKPIKMYGYLPHARYNSERDIPERYRGEVMSATPQTEARKTTRLDLRVRPDVKKIIEQAAEALGVTTTHFASATLVAEAQAVLEKQCRITLNNADRDRFLQALTSEEGPSQLLVEAAREFNKRYHP